MNNVSGIICFLVMLITDTQRHPDTQTFRHTDTHTHRPNTKNVIFGFRGPQTYKSFKISFSKFDPKTIFSLLIGK